MNTSLGCLLTGTIAVIALGFAVAREIPHKSDLKAGESNLEWINDNKHNTVSSTSKNNTPGPGHGTNSLSRAGFQEHMQYDPIPAKNIPQHARPKRWARKSKNKPTAKPTDETSSTTALPHPEGLPPPNGEHSGNPFQSPLTDDGQHWWEDVEAQIIDGKVTRPNRWEWSVALISEQYNMGFVCGGTIIDLRWVITAAHCVHSITDPGPLYAWIGAWNLTTHDYSDSVLVEEIFVHPNYQLVGSSLYDIALLKLVRPANITASTDTILTLPDPLMNLFELNPLCMIIGWGAYESNSDVMSTVLLQHWVNVISYVECQTRWDAGFVPVEIAHTNLCIDEGVNGEISACQGDSGSPLQCFDVTDRMWKLAGISSWGSGACSTYPSVYTKVSAFLDWIYATIYPARGILRRRRHHLFSDDD